MTKISDDVYGQGLLAYYQGDADAQFQVDSDVAETDYWPIAEFFHSWDDMSEIERRALTACNGRTLDVGAGSGSHTLWLQQNGVDASALDISPLAVEVMLQRGVARALQSDFFDADESVKYDTLLFLMNGAGIAGTLAGLPRFFAKCKALLAPGGQILLDSSDLIYLFVDEDGSVSLDLNAAYYGELRYNFVFRGARGPEFPWLFVDPHTLADVAMQCGLSCNVLLSNQDCQYLARLTAMP